MNTRDSFHTSRALIAVLVLLFLGSLAWLSYGNYAAGSKPLEIAVSAVLLSVPLGLLYFSIGLLVTANQQRRRQGQVSAGLAKTIYRTPRIAGLLIAIFVGLFALDVFVPGPTIWQQLAAFVIHAMPAILLAVLLALAWHRPAVGFAAFLAAAVLFLRFVIGNDLGQALGMLLLFSGPMAAIAMLFWANWKWPVEQLPAQPPQ